jgi:hypothetical protein
MKDLFDQMQQYQKNKRLLSSCVEKDGDKFCCIAFTNPTEVVITDSTGILYASVSGGKLQVYDNSRPYKVGAILQNKPL